MDSFDDWFEEERGTQKDAVEVSDDESSDEDTRKLQIQDTIS